MTPSRSLSRSFRQVARPLAVGLIGLVLSACATTTAGSPTIAPAGVGAPAGSGQSSSTGPVAASTTAGPATPGASDAVKTNQSPIDLGTAASTTISPPGTLAPGTQQTRPTTPPAIDITVMNDTGGVGDTLAKDALSDVIAYWKKVSPTVFGKELPPIKGGFWSIDPSSTSDKLPPHCLTDPKDVKNNAFFCPTDDSIVYDRVYLERISKDYSDLDVGMTFAHEFGHALQFRFLDEQKSIVLETQADCLAGVWLKSVTDGQEPHFAFDAGNLDRILGDYIWEMGDPAGYGPDAAQAHGTTFDRVSATQEGYQQGASKCVAFDRTRTFTADKFTAANSNNGNGNASLDETLTNVAPLLNEFWTTSATDVGGLKYTPPAVDVDKHGDSSCTDPHIVSVCGKTGSVDFTPKNALEGWHVRIGDFATATAMALGWAEHVQESDKALGTSPAARICAVGAFAEYLLEKDQGSPNQQILSPGDLDEAIRILVIAGKDNKLVDTGDTTAWDRLDAFRTGLTGLAPCAKL